MLLCVVCLPARECEASEHTNYARPYINKNSSSRSSSSTSSSTILMECREKVVKYASRMSCGERICVLYGCVVVMFLVPRISECGTLFSKLCAACGCSE